MLRKERIFVKRREQLTENKQVFHDRTQATAFDE